LLGNDGKEIKLATNNATNTPITRTNEILRIGSSPKTWTPPRSPRSKMRGRMATRGPATCRGARGSG
jgi:hypothetical protein